MLSVDQIHTVRSSKAFHIVLFLTLQPPPGPEFFTHPCSRDRAARSSFASVVAYCINILYAREQGTPSGLGCSSSSGTVGIWVMSALGLAARCVRSLQGVGSALGGDEVLAEQAWWSGSALVCMSQGPCLSLGGKGALSIGRSPT